METGNTISCVDPDWDCVSDDKNQCPSPEPQWADAAVDVALSAKVVESEFFMMRMSSFYIQEAQSRLEQFVAANVALFFDVSDGSSMHTVHQYSIYLDYVNLFETLMQRFMEGCSNEDTAESIKTAQSMEAAGKESMGTIMLSLLDAVTNFEGGHTVAHTAQHT
jgi:L-rhamnose mutarotase